MSGRSSLSLRDWFTAPDTQTTVQVPSVAAYTMHRKPGNTATPLSLMSFVRPGLSEQGGVGQLSRWLQSSRQGWWPLLAVVRWEDVLTRLRLSTTGGGGLRLLMAWGGAGQVAVLLCVVLLHPKALVRWWSFLPASGVVGMPVCGTSVGDMTFGSRVDWCHISEFYSSTINTVLHQYLTSNLPILYPYQYSTLVGRTLKMLSTII